MEEMELKIECDVLVYMYNYSPFQYIHKKATWVPQIHLMVIKPTSGCFYLIYKSPCLFRGFIKNLNTKSV